MWAGKTALITGASAGLGREFALQLASRGVRLCLVGRRAGLLQQIAAEISQQSGTKVEVIAMDLAEPLAAQDLLAETRLRGLSVDILVQAAALSLLGEFLDNDERSEEAAMQLNVLTLTQLTHLYVAEMLERASNGMVLLVSGVSGFQPVPEMAVFAASKAYVQHLGEALAYELKDQGITVTVLVPGGLPGSLEIEAGIVRKSQTCWTSVVTQALLGMEKGVPVVIPGRADRASLLAKRLVPRRLLPPLFHRRLKSSVTRH